MYPSAGFNHAGSLSIKTSLPMDYRRSVLSNRWHLKREAEPLDFELWSGNKPNLHQSTYKNFSKNFQNPKITYATETRCKHDETLRLLREMKYVDTKKKLIDINNKDRLMENLNSTALPKHQSEFNKHFFETTYKKEFPNTFTEIKSEKSQKAQKFEFQNSIDNSLAFRRIISQFSEKNVPCSGINTFLIQNHLYQKHLTD